MKLRIKGNSIRLRLGQSEVRRLATDGIVEESTVFAPSPEGRLVYAIHASPEEQCVSASFSGRRLVISVPTSEIHKWAATDQIGISALHPAGGDNELRILIEKDFECADGSSEESQEDAFPHPQLAAACPASK